MKHTDRQAIGLELFFATRSGSFSGLKDLSSEDIGNLADNAPAYARYPVAREIHSALEELTALDCCPTDRIPAEIMELAGRHSVAQYCEKSAITTFFGWLQELSIRNETDRVERISGLKTVASFFDPQTASFIRTGLALNNQRVFISHEGDTITVSYPEREWGRVYIDFTGCELPEDHPALPMPGYSFSTEAERTDDERYRFGFLIDTCFSSNDYCERLMQPNGWRELSFTCASIEVRAVLCDYVGRLDRVGTPRAELIDRASSILLSKLSVLGDDGLSSAESSMVAVARLLTGCGGLLTEPKSKQWQSEQLILDALDNRYAMQQFKQLLKESKCERLLDQLSTSGQSRFDDNESDAISGTRRFASMYEQQIAEGTSRQLMLTLTRRFLEMTRDFSGITRRSQAEETAAERVRSAVAEQMGDLRFEGQFPHYRRTRHRRTEYLSFMLLPAADHSRHGIFSFYISLAAARVSGKRMRLIEQQGISLEQTNALDCQPEISSVCDYGELASADDGEFVRIDANMFDSVKRGKLADDTSRLERYIKLANRQFRLGGIPAGYALSRLRKNLLPSPAPQLFLSSLPLSAVISLLSVIAWHLLSDIFSLPALTLTTALAFAGGMSFILNSIITLLRRFHIAGKLWRYR